MPGYESVQRVLKGECAWCGKSTSDLKRIHPKIPRAYCSRSCSAAKNFYLWLILTILSPLLLLVQVFIIIDYWPVDLSLESIIQYVLLANYIILIVISWYYIYLGYKKRRE